MRKWWPALVATCATLAYIAGLLWLDRWTDATLRESNVEIALIRRYGGQWRWMTDAERDAARREMR